MKNLLIASAAALLFGTLGATAQPYRSDTYNSDYVSVLGGATWAPDLNVGGVKRPMDTGFNVGARYGHYLDSWGIPNLSVEADGLFSQSNFKGANAGRIQSSRIQSSSYMGNLIYHVPTASPFSLYGGAGVGLVHTNFDNNLGNHGGSDVLGWQAIGGVDYRLNEMTGLFAEYRYQNAHDVNAGGIRNIGNTSNNLSVGVKWNLN